MTIAVDVDEDLVRLRLHGGVGWSQSDCGVGG